MRRSALLALLFLVLLAGCRIGDPISFFAEDKAIELKNDYFEAITYKNLLLRLQANVEKDPAKQQALLKEADRLRDQAQELRKKQQAGAAGE